MSPNRAIVLVWVATLAGCQPTTLRPAFLPFPEAASTEMRLTTDDAIRRLAEALRADSIPVAKVERRDGYLDSGWFASATGTPVHHRPVGPSVVRVRGWVNPGRPYASVVILETVYRPLADPSRSDRDLEEPVPADHPVAVKMHAVLDSMVKRYGGTPDSEPASQAKPTAPQAKPTAPQAKPTAPQAKPSTP
jgi:hypothetical protein